MKAYRAIVSARFRMMLQYRAAAAAGLGTQLFWGFIRIMIFTAFYRFAKAPQPMTLEQVVSYVWLGQAMLAMLPWSVEPDLRVMIRSGNVAYELLRPVDLYWLWFSRSVARRSAPTLLRAVPMLIVAGLFFGLRAPQSVGVAAAWLAAMAGAFVLSCAISTILSISLLWTVSGEGVMVLMSGAAWLLSGMIIPLPLFPDWAQGILAFLPFRGVVDAPYRVYMGNIPLNEVWVVLAHQLAWIAAFVVVGRALVGRGLRRLAVQGG